MSSVPYTIISPAFANNTEGFVFATNDAYAPYLGVALCSFIAHTSKEKVYDICILYTDVSTTHQKALCALQCENISIRFIDMSPILAHIEAALHSSNSASTQSKMETSLFVTHAHFSKEAYYRFFIPPMFSAYEKIAYMDCDMIFLTDMSALFMQNIENKALAAVLEYKFKCKVEYDPLLRQYAHEVLQLNNVQHYCNSGLLIFDIPQLAAAHFTEQCLETLQRVQRPRTVDQCVINAVMQDNIFFLNPAWNVQTHVNVKELQQYVSPMDYKDYVKSLLKPHVIHYCSPLKPWNTPQVPLGKVWWQYAKTSIFFAK